MATELTVFRRKVWLDGYGRILISKVRKHEEQAATLYIIGTAKFEENKENAEWGYVSMTPVTIRWLKAGETREKGLVVGADEGEYAIDFRRGHKFNISKVGEAQCEAEKS